MNANLTNFPVLSPTAIFCVPQRIWHQNAPKFENGKDSSATRNRAYGFPQYVVGKWVGFYWSTNPNV